MRRAKWLLVALPLILCLRRSWALPAGNLPSINQLPLQLGDHTLDGTTKVTVRDPDAIVYPDEIIRDSYGNAVTPFSGLVEDHNVDIGHMTDINAKHPPVDNRGTFEKKATTDASGFVIPSYASGITKVETLFPNAPKFPLIAPPTKGQGFDQPAPPPSPPPASDPIELSNDILPPFKDDGDRIIYPTIEVNTQATLFFPDPSFFNNDKKKNNHNNDFINNNTPAPSPPPATTRSPPPVHGGGVISGDDGDIYRGSFGGAPGILGEPQPLGSAYTPKNEERPSIPSSAVEIPKIPVHHHQHVQIPVQSSPSREPQAPHHSHGSFLDLNLLPPLPPQAPHQQLPPSPAVLTPPQKPAVSIYVQSGQESARDDILKYNHLTINRTT